MKNNVLTALLTVISVYAAIIGTINVFSAKKIGYIDSVVLLNKYQGAVEAREELKKEVDKYVANQKTLEAELMELNKKIMEKGNSWSKSKLQKERKKFAEKQAEFARYSRSTNEKAKLKEKELFDVVYTELNVKLKLFSESEGYDILFGTVSGGNILYGTEKSNLTEEFLKFIEIEN